MKAEVAHADAVIHAGDFTSEECYDSFIDASKAFYAVRGNNDFFRLPAELRMELDGIKIAVIHGHQARSTYENWLVYYFKDYQPDIIIFGHTHAPLLRKMSDGTTLLNPGSVTHRRGAPYHSIAEIDTSENPFKARIIALD
jgi:putative phosphoesterase